ncbi:hypothetical protein T10_5193 [Trichinella papuae]|uniref:CCHC-type domain-containing protein n=1 Tax=Trichinella papuae TaxID=268474 RepID=A0A0V1MTV0_9BILA|nr:hypothetical protein T10_5193 [Trichinella papuae]
MSVDDGNGDSVINAKEPECQEGITVDTVVTSQRGVVSDQVVVCRCLEDCFQCETVSTLDLVSIDSYRDGSQCNTVKVGSSNVIDFPAFQYEKRYSPLRSRASESVDFARHILVLRAGVVVISKEKSSQFNTRSQSGSIHHESRDFDASHPDDIRELLEEVMAFRDKALEVQLQLEEALKGEERDQEATQWYALNERIQMARREARAKIRQMEGSSSDGSARSNDLDPRNNSKPKANERLPELKMPVFSGKVIDFPAFWDRFQGSVHSRTDLDDTSKFAYLLSSLSGEALAASRFGRKDAIVREHVKAIWNAKPCSDSGSGTQALIDEIQRHLRCLSALGKDPSTGEMTASEAFLPLLAERFPEEIRLAWDIHVQSASGVKRDLRVSRIRSDPDDSEMRSGCDLRRRTSRQVGRVEAARTRIRSSGAAPNTTNGTTGRKVATTVLHTAVSSSCPICNGGHDVASCEEFLKAKVHTRSRMAARCKLCFRCLQSGHRAKACKVGRKCTVSGCGGSHHRLLHRSQSPSPDQTPDALKSRGCMLIAGGGA